MADSKETARDNQDGRSPSFTRALMGRVLAVGLFVVLGTFAVAHSMSKPKLSDEDSVAANTEIDVQVDADKPSATVAATTATAPKTLIKPKVSNNLFGRSPASKPVVPAIRTGFASKPISKPAVAQSRPAASSSKTSPLRSSFGPRPTARPTRPAVSGTSARPTTPNRFAQRPSSQAPSIQGTLNGLKTKVVNSANDMASGASSRIKTKTDQAAKSIRGNFSGFSSNPTATTKPPATPVVNRTFGMPNANQPTASRSFGSAARPAAPSNTAAFDTSRNLKPVTRSTTSPATQNNDRRSFGNVSSRTPARPTASASQPRTFGRDVPASTRSRTSTGTANRNTNSSRNPFGQTASSQTPRSTTPPGNTARTNRAPAASPVAASNRTSDAPGDRELEGVQAPALTVEKLSPREIQVNRESDFAIIVRNVGRAMAQDVVVYDEVPEGTEFLSAVPEATRNGSRLTWNIGALRPGQEKRINLQLKPTRPGDIGSVAHVTFSTQATMRTRVTKPVLSIRHSAKPQHLIGDAVTLDVIVENKGDGPATDVIIQEDVPKQLEFADGYRELEYEIGTLMPGQSKRVKLGLRAAQIGRLRNVMFASAKGGLRAKHEIDMEVIAPKLETFTAGPTRRFLQRRATHQFSVENSGTAKATNVELVARLPSGLRYVAANNQGRYDSNAHAVFWSLAELQPSIKASVELETMPVDVGEQGIKFEALADLNQKSAANQPLSVEHLVDVFFDIDDVVDPIEIGSDTSYKIRVANQGTKTATNVKLQVEFPNGIRPTGVDGNLRNEIRGQSVVFAPISSMGAGEEISLIVRGSGTAAGDHRVSLSLTTDGRQTQATKEETTRVYADR